MYCGVVFVFSRGKLLTVITNLILLRKGRFDTEDKSAAAYMAGSLKTAAHAAILTHSVDCMYLYGCRWVHILGDPRSVQLRKAITTTEYRATLTVEGPWTLN